MCVAVWSLQRALCHCVTKSINHCVTVSLCHCVCAGLVPQQHSVRVAVWLSQRALCHCVTMSLSHCVTVSLCVRRCRAPGALSECGSLVSAMGTVVTVLLYHCVTVCAQASCPSGTQCVWQSGLCNGHCVTVSLCVRRPCAPAALSACASLVSATGTVSLCHCVTLCAQASCPRGTQCVWQSGLCNGQACCHYVTVSLGHCVCAGLVPQRHSVRVAVWSLQRALCHCVTVCAQASCPSGTQCVCQSGLCNGHCVTVSLRHYITVSLYHCVTMCAQVSVPSGNQ